MNKGGVWVCGFDEKREKKGGWLRLMSNMVCLRRQKKNE